MIVAIAIGLTGGVFAVGVMMGMIEARIHEALHNEVSHIQIHHPKFLENDEIKYNIPNADELISEIRSMDAVDFASARSKMIAMAQTSNASTGITIYGINPEEEKKVTEIHKAVIDTAGNYFKHGKSNQIVIGRRLAEKLKLANYQISERTLEALREHGMKDILLDSISTLTHLYRSEKKFMKDITRKIGKAKAQKYEFVIKENAVNYKVHSKIVLTLTGKEEYLTGGAFRVTGVYKTNNSKFEEQYVFVRMDDLTRITGYSRPQIHEIAIMLKDRENVLAIQEKLQKKYPDLTVRSWKDIQPDIAMISDFMGYIHYVFIAFILFALAFGIVNTMLMAVLERVKELGMLMAIGMNRKRVFTMIMLETIFLSLTGAVVGMIAGGTLTWATSKTGINLSRYTEGFEAIGYGAKVFPEITPDFFFGVTLLVILTGILASVYPALKALKLKPAEALSIE